MPAVFNKFDIDFSGAAVIIRAMRYWIFQNNQVNGPFEPDDLAQVPGYSAEALVCPEGRRGTNMGDWQRAGMVGELSVSLLKAAQLSAMPVGAGGGGIYGTLPPEPTLKDLAVLGSLQEKISVLEGVLSQLQDALRAKDSELLALHREVEEKNNREGELAIQIGGLEERLANVQKLRANLDEAIAAEKAVESTVSDVEKSVKGVEATLKDMESVVERQRSTIEDLTKQLDELKQQRAQDSVQIQEIKARPSGAAAAIPPVAMPAGKPEFADPLPAAEPASGPAAEGLQPPPSAIKPFDAPPVLDLDAPPMPAGVSLEVTPPPPPVEQPKGFAETPAPTAVPFPEPPSPDIAPPAFPIESEKNEADLKPAVSAESLAGKAEPELAGPPAAPKSKLGPVIAAAAVLLALGGGYVFMTGGGSKPVYEEPVLEAPPPMPEQPLVDSQLEELKQQAIGLVRMWPSGDGLASVGQRLESMPPSAAQANPWSSEKLAEGLFQVTYYAAASGGGETSFQFQVRPAEKQVSAINMAAKDLLEPRPVVKAPEAPKRKRRVRVRPKAPPVEDSGLLDNPLDAALNAGDPLPAPRRKRSPEENAPDEASLDELLQPEPEREAPKPRAAEGAAAAKPAPRRVVPAAVVDKEPSDAELLDELLKP